MKTKELQQAKYTRAIKLFALFAMVLILSSGIYAQRKTAGNFGIMLNAKVTGSGFGAQYNLKATYSKNNNLIAAGLIFQHRGLNLSGVGASYERTLFDGASPNNSGFNFNNVELFALISASYHYNALLGNRQLKTEKQADNESNIQFNCLKYKAIEAYVGFGLNIKLGKHIKWSNAIAYGGWNTLNGECRIYREKQGTGISLRTGLYYQFGK